MARRGLIGRRPNRPTETSRLKTIDGSLASSNVMGKPVFDVEDAFDIFTPFIVLLIAFFAAKFLRRLRLRLRLWRQNRRFAREERQRQGRLTDGLVGLTEVTTEAVTARPEPPRLQVRREWTPASPEVPTAPRRPAAAATAAKDRRLSRLKEYAYDASAEQADGDECTICFEDFSGGERIRELPCGTIGHRASRGRRTRPHFTSSFSDLRTVLSFSLSGVAGHTFHVDCVDEWLLRHASCPICRRDVFATTASAPPRAPLTISDGYHAGRGVRAAAAVAAAARTVAVVRDKTCAVTARRLSTPSRCRPCRKPPRTRWLSSPLSLPMPLRISNA